MPMTTLELTEREGSRIAQREGKGDVYKIRIMGWEPGADAVEGSSAVYPVAHLKRDIPTAFPEGTRMRANHDGICEAGGDIRRVIARTTDTPWAESDGMYTHMRVSEQWGEYVREYGDIIGLSISAAGELESFNDESSDDYDPEAPKTLKRLLSAEESPYNSIDFVEAPGADGRIVMAIESAKNTFAEMNIREAAKFASGITERKTSGAVPPQKTKEGIVMDDETRAIVEAAATAAATQAVEALKPRETPQEVKYENVAEAAFEAGLSKGSRAAVYEAVRAGATVEEAVAREKAREDEIEARVSERFEAERVASGYTVGESAGAIDTEFEALVGGGN